MDDKAKLKFQEERIRCLSKEKEAALAALNAASHLGRFESGYSKLPDSGPILEEIANRVQELFPLKAGAIFLVNESTHDFELVSSFGQAEGFKPETEIDSLIGDHSFSYALSLLEPTFFSAASTPGRLILHPIASPSRMRGMFLGLLSSQGQELSDISLALFTVVLNAGAQSLESFELYRHMKEINLGLERTVAQRTLELRQSYEQVRMILDSIPAGVVVIDPQSHRILDVNPAGSQMIGLAREEIVGRLCFDCFCPALQGACPVVNGGQTLYSSERVIRTETGREVPILKTAVRTSLAGRDCIIESFVDISEQKKLEQLRDDVERITRHDLKGPLSGVISLPDLMAGDPEMPEHLVEIAGLIKESGLKILNMINLSFDLYKMETGTYELNPRPVDLAAVLRNAIKDLQAHASARKVGFEFVQPKPEGPVLVLGEELLYFSLFMNLLKNALEASPKAGLVEIGLKREADKVTVSVHNQKPVPAEIRDKFFGKYATHGKAGGTGLGAYSSQLIAKAHGGKIDLLTSEEHGTTLSVILPVFSG